MIMHAEPSSNSLIRTLEILAKLVKVGNEMSSKEHYNEAARAYEIAVNVIDELERSSVEERDFYLKISRNVYDRIIESREEYQEIATSFRERASRPRPKGLNDLI